MDYKSYIESGKASLGIELGSTRIKAVLIDNYNSPIAIGEYQWENQLIDGIWTYRLDDIWTGLQGCYSNLLKNVKNKYGCVIKSLAALGFSGMMHGYMAFNRAGELLVPFRTWRNTITGQASEELTKMFNYHIPQRWTIAHLYQNMLNGEEHVKDIDTLLTLSGYISWKMTGKKVVGIGEVSGMFPVDIEKKDYCSDMIDKFNSRAHEMGYIWNIEDILPKVAVAGEIAGYLTEEGARKLDLSGNLESGVLVAPAEGDAGTGMVATNSVAVRTGNVSAGTSIFGMVVLEKNLKRVHDEIDIVTTPSGNLVAMAHCNNCTSDLNAWLDIFKEFAELYDLEIEDNDLYGKLYNHALRGDADAGGLLAYNYYSGEHVTGFDEGRPLFVRKPDSKFTLSNFIRCNLYASLSVLKMGFDILSNEEGVKIDMIYGHGGLFKTKGVCQNILAAALNTPVSVMETAGEGGAWGMAILASYMVHKDNNQSLENFLSTNVFKGNIGTSLSPNHKDVEGFKIFMNRYTEGLSIERAAVNHMLNR